MGLFSRQLRVHRHQSQRHISHFFIHLPQTLFCQFEGSKIEKKNICRRYYYIIYLLPIWPFTFNLNIITCNNVDRISNKIKYLHININRCAMKYRICRTASALFRKKMFEINFFCLAKRFKICYAYRKRKPKKFFFVFHYRQL